MISMSCLNNLAILLFYNSYIFYFFSQTRTFRALAFPGKTETSDSRPRTAGRNPGRRPGPGRGEPEPVGRIRKKEQGLCEWEMIPFLFQNRLNQPWWMDSRVDLINFFETAGFQDQRT